MTFAGDQVAVGTTAVAVIGREAGVGRASVKNAGPNEAYLGNANVAPTGGTVTAMAGTNNDLAFATRDPANTDVTVTFVDPPGNNVALSVAVAGEAITVTLATDGSSAITSTAALVLAAIQAHATANGLVVVANAAGNDGTGVVTALAATPVGHPGYELVSTGSVEVDVQAGDELYAICATSETATLHVLRSGA